MSEQFSTTKTVHKHPKSSSLAYNSFTRRPSHSTHAVPTPHSSAPSHPKITGLATPLHSVSPSTETQASSSSTNFAYPTPTGDAPAASGTVMGLSLTLTFILLGLIVAGALWFVKRRSSKRRRNVRKSGVEGGFVEIDRLNSRVSTVSAPEPVHAAPERPVRDSVSGNRVTRFFQGRRVPSGWL